MRFTLTALLCAALLALSPLGNAGFLDQEITFTEAEVQAALARNTKTEMRYPGLIAVALREPPSTFRGSAQLPALVSTSRFSTNALRASSAAPARLSWKVKPCSKR